MSTIPLPDSGFNPKQTSSQPSRNPSMGLVSKKTPAQLHQSGYNPVIPQKNYVPHFPETLMGKISFTREELDTLEWMERDITQFLKQNVVHTVYYAERDKQNPIRHVHCNICKRIVSEDDTKEDWHFPGCRASILSGIAKRLGLLRLRSVLEKNK